MREREGKRTGEESDLDPGPLLFIDSPVAGARGRIKIKTCFSVHLPVPVQGDVGPFLTQTTVS